MAAKTVSWTGASGKEYVYGIFVMGTSFKKKPGNYIFAKETSVGGWQALYIGQTDNLNERLSDHEKLPCVEQYSGTHIHAHLNSGVEQVRRAEEADLLATLDPPCNKE